MRATPTRTHTGNGHERTREGFSLIELMIVVVIMGVLAAIAIPTFSSYVYKSRTTEATQFLGTIRLREEAFKAEFGQYCNAAHASSVGCVTQAAGRTDLTNATLVPSYDTLGKDPQLFPTDQQSWNELGARPSQQTRFAFGVVAGVPATAPADRGWTDATRDFWFIAQAVGNLDGDSQHVTFETYSQGTSVWVGTEGDQPLAQGWE